MKISKSVAPKKLEEDSFEIDENSEHSQEEEQEEEVKEESPTMMSTILMAEEEGQISHSPSPFYMFRSKFIPIRVIDVISLMEGKMEEINQFWTDFAENVEIFSSLVTTLL